MQKPNTAWGWSLYHLEQLEVAIQPLLNAINLKPDLGAAYFSLGQTYAALGYFEKAIDEFKETLRLIQNYPEAYISLGDSYLKIRDYDLAIGAYREAIELNPGFF